MCNCIKELEEKLKTNYKSDYPELENAKLINVEVLSGRIYSTVEIHIKGKKKPITQYILHSHCPICGKKYDEQ
jgi:hypothetical protein